MNRRSGVSATKIPRPRSVDPKKMNPNPIVPSRAIGAFCIFAFLLSYPAVAQSPPSSTTWADLGFGQVPEGTSTNEIALFEGLNKARGTWSFEATTGDAKAGNSVEGSLIVMGNPKSGMIPSWKMVWGWPADQPKQMINGAIMAAPGRSGFELMLFRSGPVSPTAGPQAKQQLRPALFRGKWDLASRTITWTEREMPRRPDGQAADEDASKPKQSFEMVVAADGKISIRNSKHVGDGQLTSSKVIARTGEAPAEPITLIGKHDFPTAAEIADRRIKPCIPPTATEVSLLSERGGHFARYKVSEVDFRQFLDQLWEAKKDTSAHKREQMSGEGEPVNRERMAKRFSSIGWKPLDNAITYYSPSKGSGAMTTYYYDKEAGIAYHDAGYW